MQPRRFPASIVRLPRGLLGFALLFAVVLLQQHATGAYRAELAGEPDEAAHYVTGLMVHDYIRAGCPPVPVHFAEQYYIHYPKVAFGHWPPLFYVLQAGWALLFAPSISSMLLLMAAIAAAFAWLVFCAIRERFGMVAAAALTAILLLSNAFAAAAMMIMADLLVAALCLLGVLEYARYMDTGRARYSVMFGVCFALGMLTKESAAALALVPPVCIAASGRWSWLKRFSFWSPAAILLLAYLPWYIRTHQMLRNALYSPDSPVAWAVAEAQHTAVLVYVLFGPALFAMFLIGAAVTAVKVILRREAVDPVLTAFGAVTAGTILLYMLVPARVEPRRMLVIAPAMLLFAAAGWEWVARRVRNRSVLAAGFAVMLISFFLARPPLPEKPVMHYADVIRTLRADLGSAAAVEPRWMIAADAAQEGAFTAAVAVGERRPATVVVRASKLLASALWSGGLYRARYGSPAEILDLLDSASITHAVVSSPASGMPHIEAVAAALSASDDWVPLSLPPGVPKAVRAYRRRDYVSRRQRPIRVDMSYMLNRTIEQESVRTNEIRGGQ